MDMGGKGVIVEIFLLAESTHSPWTCRGMARVQHNGGAPGGCSQCQKKRQKKNAVASCPAHSDEAFPDLPDLFPAAHGNGFNFHLRAKRQGRNLHTGARRARLREIFFVNLVYFGEIGHIGDKNRSLENI